MKIICQDKNIIKFEDFQNLFWNYENVSLYMENPNKERVFLGKYKDNLTAKWVLADINNNRLRGTEEYKMPSEDAKVEDYKYKNLKEIISLCEDEIENEDINTHATLDLVDLIELRLLLRGEE